MNRAKRDIYAYKTKNRGSSVDLCKMKTDLLRGLMAVFVIAGLGACTDAPSVEPDAAAATIYRGGSILSINESPVMDALKSITINATYQHFEEDRKGSLEAGKLADFVILDQNPLDVEPADLASIRVMETIKEGVTI